MNNYHTLTSEKLSVDVDQKGSFVRGLRFKLGDIWTDIFQPGKSLFVMGPYAGRIIDCAFPWQGGTFKLSHPEDPKFGMHGSFRYADWQIKESGPGALTLQMESRDIAERYSFPSRYQAEIRYQVTQNRFSIKLQVKNTGDVLMPFGTGPHMYCLKQPNGTSGKPQLRHNGKRWFPIQEAAPLPVGGPEELPSDRKYPNPAPWIEHWDHCVGEWGHEATISWPELSIVVRDDLNNCPYMQIWNMPENSVCALEPQTMCPTKFGDTPEAMEYGCLLLEPLQEFGAAWSFDFNSAGF